MKTITAKAFTLVELLIVIGIIGILAVTLLLNLNPGEAQKKARDATRLKDLSTLQVIVEQLVADGTTIPNADTLYESHTSNTPTATVCSGTGWLPYDVCSYSRNLPLDPRNGSGITYYYNNAAGVATTGASTGRYRARFFQGQYKISALLESKANASKPTLDGGTSVAWFEVYSAASARL